MIFFDITSKVLATKTKLNRYIKVKVSVQKRSNQKNEKPTGWEKIFVNHISDKGLISKIDKALTIQYIKKWTDDLTRYFSEEYI